MLIDSSDLCDQTVADVRVCIVGAGAAGITLACELDGCGHKVLLLEAGGLKPTAATQDYYVGAANPPHPKSSEWRRVVFGGTTGVWGGRCVPFDPIDFEPREYVTNSGWPISYDEIARYYPQALRYCEAGEFDFTATASIDCGIPTVAGWTSDGVVDNDLIERYSPPTRFGKKYRSALRASQNVTAILGTRCIGLRRAAGDNRIEGVEVVLQSGKRRVIGADIVILAMGGIETARILLASDRNGIGLGNRTDRVGRFYSCHLGTVVGKFVPLRGTVAFDFEKTRDGIYCRRKFQFTAAAQREHRLLNTAFRLHFPAYSDASHKSSVMSTIYLAKSMLIPEYRKIIEYNAEHLAVKSPARQHWRNVVMGMPQVIRFGIDWAFRIHLARREMPYTLVESQNGSYPLEFNCEQTPMESSRIMLLAERDKHAIPRVHIDWRRSDEDIVAAHRGFIVLREALSRTGVCRLEFDDSKLHERLASAAPIWSHHLGTTRMAMSPSNGVVDTNCAIFDLPNVYVASSAVFPTGSHANPTLTIVALSLRMAEHLRGRLNAPIATAALG
jgi:choline dehydrogenase-like flavoprotein